MLILRQRVGWELIHALAAISTAVAKSDAYFGFCRCGGWLCLLFRCCHGRRLPPGPGRYTVFFVMTAARSGEHPHLCSPIPPSQTIEGLPLRSPCSSPPPCLSVVSFPSSRSACMWACCSPFSPALAPAPPRSPAPPPRTPAPSALLGTMRPLLTLQRHNHDDNNSTGLCSI